MPPKKAGGVGGADKVGNASVDDKQKRLSAEEDTKRITFASSVSTVK